MPDDTTAPSAPAPTPEPAAAPPPKATDPAPKTLESSLAGLDDDTRRFVLGEVSRARSEAQGLRTRLNEAAPKLTEYDRLVEASKTDLERAQAAARAAEERAAKNRDRAVRAEVKALAADRFADPGDAAAFLDLGSYADGDDIDAGRIRADLDDLLTRKPHLAKPSGPRKPTPDPTQAAGANAGGGTADPASQFAAFMQGALRQSS
jgi:hypothetical protein